MSYEAGNLTGRLSPIFVILLVAAEEPVKKHFAKSYDDVDCLWLGCVGVLMSHVPLDAGTFAQSSSFRTEKVLFLAQIWPSNQAATSRGNGPSGISSLIPLGSLESLGLLGCPRGGSLGSGCHWLGPIKRPIKARHGWPGQAGPYVDDEVYRPVKEKVREQLIPGFF